MWDERMHPGDSDSIVALLPAAWSKHPPGRRQIFRFIRSAITERALPPRQEGWLVERLAELFNKARPTRRQFLTWTAMGGLAVVVESQTRRARADGLAVPEGSLVATLDAPTFTADMLRPQDMLALRFEFFNL